MKKKLVVLLLTTVLALSTFTGCNKADDTQPTTDVTIEDTTDAENGESQDEDTGADDSTDETSDENTDENTADDTSADSDAEPAEGAPEVTELGEGEVTFMFEVITADKETTYFQISTNETTVGAALLNLELIAGDDSEYGLYVKTVNGVTADYDTDGTYWAFYINGEYAMTGVDSTEIVDGATYTFAVE